MIDMIEITKHAVFKIIGYIMWLAPIGAMGAIGFTVGKFGVASLVSLGTMVAEFYLTCIFFVCLVLWPIARWNGVNLWRLIRYIRTELLIVFGTSSSESVFPQLVNKLQMLGCEEAVVGLVLPTGYAFNHDGTCLYFAAASVFLAQAVGIDLSLGQQLGLLGILLLSSKGGAGVAGRRSWSLYPRSPPPGRYRLPPSDSFSEFIVCCPRPLSPSMFSAMRWRPSSSRGGKVPSTEKF